MITSAPRYRLSLEAWQGFALPPTEVIIAASPDRYDEFKSGLRNDPHIPEPIGTHTCFGPADLLPLRRPARDREQHLLQVAFVEQNDQNRRGTQPVHRRAIAATLAAAGFPNRPCSPRRFYAELARSAFCASPAGNGLDCHRHYEALYLGAIPIIEASPEMEAKFADLPVLFTTDYREITAAYLRDQYAHFRARTFDFSRLLRSAYDDATRARLDRRRSYWHTHFHRLPPTSPPPVAAAAPVPAPTLVTGLSDFGVHTHPSLDRRYHQRHLATYQTWLEPLLALAAPMVIHVDPSLVDWVHARRRHQPQTEVHPVDLTTSPYLPRLQEILADFRRPVRRPDRPEVKLPAYNAFMFNKVEWVHDAAIRNPFGSHHFLWIDAGLGHGQLTRQVPAFEPSTWPRREALHSWDDDRLRLLALASPRLLDLAAWPTVLDRHENTIAGNAWGGTTRALTAATPLFREVVAHTLREGWIDDDQAIWRLAWSLQPGRFQLVQKRRFGLVCRDWLHLVKQLA